MELSNNQDLKFFIKRCLDFLNEHSVLTELYIIEYFTEQHWKKLPNTWQKCLGDMQAEDLADVLQPPGKLSQRNVWPLSLLAFLKCTKTLQVSRSQTGKYKDVNCANYKDKQKHMFQKHVNPKKQHEITVLSKVITSLFKEEDCSCVIDVGSGQGHLSRLLSLGCGFSVFAMEHEEVYLAKAKKYDNEAQLHFTKVSHKKEKLTSPRHIQYTIAPNVDSQTFLKALRSNHHVTKEIDILENHPNHHSTQRCLITGLHACGDLSATMIRLFKESEEIHALVSVACCYMKLTTDSEEKDKTFRICAGNQPYYPMSNYVKSIENHKIPYKARELACHAIEDYYIRLKENKPHLKMHCYRAVLEHLIRKHHPHLIRPGVQTVKKAYLLPFNQYVEKAFKKLNLQKLDGAEILTEEIDEMLAEWNKVLIIFTLSLMMAPVIETVILLDRIIYLAENDIQSELLPIFDPVTSPRCFAIISKKS